MKDKLLQFHGLNAPVRVEGGGWVLGLLRTIMPQWHFERSADKNIPPFASLRENSDGTLTVTTFGSDEFAKTWDPVNAICDLIAEMAWERLRSRPDLFCLHAAAIEFDGRLIVFPNGRRTGKSTLAIALGLMGHRLFTDDFLPVEIESQSGKIRGIANGISPRLRLPIPASFSKTLKTRLEADSGPANDQYKYLKGLPIADHGESLPLGAIVMLNRNDDTLTPVWEPLDRETALAGIIQQNFSRDMHAARILRSFDALSESVPIFRLTYSNAEIAAEFLDRSPLLLDLPEARDCGAEILLRAEKAESMPVGFSAEWQFMRVPGLTEVELKGTNLVADSEGVGIYELNAGSAAIWRILAEPETVDSVSKILAAAFPDADSTQIHVDSENAIRDFLAAGLIKPNI